MGVNLESFKLVNLCNDPAYEAHSPFCKLLMNMPVIACVLKMDGETIFVNRAVYPATGYQPKELIGKNWWDTFFPGEYRKQVDSYLARVEAEGDIEHMEMTLVTRSGEPATFLCNSVNLYNEKGEVEAILRYGTNITERKKALDALRESEERFRQLSEVGFEGIVVHDGAHIINANRSFIEMFGYSLEELRQLTTLEGFFTPETWETAQSHIATGDPEPYEAVGVRKDGSVFPMLIRGKLVPHLDRYIRISAVLDMTRIKQVEADLRRERDVLSKLMETSPVGIALMNRDGQFTFVNRRAEDILGLPREEVIHRSFDDPMRHITDCDGFPIPKEMLPFYKAKVTGEPVLNACEAIEMPDGRRKMISLNDAPLYNEEGKFDGVVAILEDITERKRTEKELASLYHRLENRAAELAQSNADLERFAFIASHDLKEPLNVIIGYGRLLEERVRGKVDEKTEEFLQAIREEAGLMQRLIDGLLELSRVSTRAKPFVSVDTNLIMKQTLIKLQRQIKENGAEITYDDLPVIIADHDQMGQVFQNLISNALKFRREETPRIHISAKKDAADWQFSVSDNGTGIAEKHYQRIFQMFQRVNSGRTKPGYGIGLAICEKIIRRHGGTIRVESEPGKGSTFYFTIPLNPSDSKDN